MIQKQNNTYIFQSAIFTDEQKASRSSHDILLLFIADNNNNNVHMQMKLVRKR